MQKEQASKLKEKNNLLSRHLNYYKRKSKQVQVNVGKGGFQYSQGSL
jgi:hypothetical protein